MHVFLEVLAGFGIAAAIAAVVVSVAFILAFASWMNSGSH